MRKGTYVLPNDNYIPLSFVVNVLKEQNYRRLLCQDFIFFIPFISIFYLFLTYAYFNRITECNQGYIALQQALTDTFDPREVIFPDLPPGSFKYYHASHSFDNLRSPEDWHAWARSVLISKLYDSDNPNISTTTANYLQDAGQVIKVGALRIRAWGNGISEDGVSYDKSNQSFGPLKFFSPSNCHWRQGIRGTFYPCKMYKMDIPFSATFIDAMNSISSLWTDSFNVLDFTRVDILSADFFVFSPSTLELASVEAITEVEQEGFIHTYIRVTFIPVLRDHKVLAMLLVLISICVLQLVREVLILITGRTRFSVGRSVIQFLYLIFTLTLCILALLRIYTTPSFKLKAGMDEYLDNMFVVTAIINFEKHFASIAILLVSVHFILLLTLSTSINFIFVGIIGSRRSLGAILFLFFLVIIAYSLSGFILFSEGVPEYSSLGSSFFTSIISIFGIDLYDYMNRINSVVTFFFYWSFVIITVIILLNFFVGILKNSLIKKGETGLYSSLSFKNELKRYKAVLLNTFYYPKLLRQSLYFFFLISPADEVMNAILEINEQTRRNILENVFLNPAQRHQEMTKLLLSDPVPKGVLIERYPLTYFTLPVLSLRPNAIANRYSYYLSGDDAYNLYRFYVIDGKASGNIPSKMAPSKYLIDKETFEVRIWNEIHFLWQRYYRKSSRKGKLSQIQKQVVNSIIYESLGLTLDDEVRKVENVLDDIEVMIELKDNIKNFLF